MAQDSRDGWLGNGATFTVFYRQHAEAVLVYFARRTLEPDVAMDLTAETFAQAYAGRRGFRGTSEAEAAGWLFGIARNLLFGFYRRGRLERRALARLGVESPLLEDEDIARIEQLAGLQQLRGALAEQLPHLSAAQRDALRLRVVDELPYPQVASRLGVSEQTARARVSRALRSLAAAIDPTPAMAEEPH